MRSRSLTLAIALTLLGGGRAGGATFRIQLLGPQTPFVEVAVWAPPPGAGGGPFPTLVLLHGNQPQEPHRTWLIGLSRRPELRRSILIVPGLPRDDYGWDRPATARAIVSLVDRLGRTHPVDRSAVFLVGYSAGGSRVLAVAQRGWPRFAGVAAVAGDIGRPLRAGRVVLPRRPPAVLLVCMSEDRGPNASCSLDARNERLLRARGVKDLTTRKLDGHHGLRFELIGPLLDRWIRAHRRGAKSSRSGPAEFSVSSAAGR